MRSVIAQAERHGVDVWEVQAWYLVQLLGLWETAGDVSHGGCGGGDPGGRVGDSSSCGAGGPSPRDMDDYVMRVIVWGVFGV